MTPTDKPVIRHADYIPVIREVQEETGQLFLPGRIAGYIQWFNPVKQTQYFCVPFQNKYHPRKPAAMMPQLELDGQQQKAINKIANFVRLRIREYTRILQKMIFFACSVVAFLFFV